MQYRFAIIPIVSIAADLLLSTFATASEIPAVSTGGDNAAGISAAILLSALTLYALYVATRPVIATGKGSIKWPLLFLSVLFILKTVGVALCPGFSVDVGTYEAWALEMARVGPAAMYRPGFFIDYPPGYLYALWAVGLLAHRVAATGVVLRMIVESPALVADVALAFSIFVFVRRYMKSLISWVALLFVALNPALLFDTVGWGQTDSALALVLFLGTVMLIDAELELGWALAALAVLIKPQALTLLPVFALWTALKGGFRQWSLSLLAFIAVIIVGVAPFQVGHPWTWLPQLYASTAAYYHETSVNAFNFMALIGGLRRNDADLFLIVTYFTFGLTILAMLYLFIGWILYREPTNRSFLFASFIALFGFFMFAPRMHERYLYTAIIFAVPLAVAEPAMLAIFLLLTLTCLVNLSYVLRTLNTTVFLDSRDALAMAIALLNSFSFAIALVYGCTRPGRSVSPFDSANNDSQGWLHDRLSNLRKHFVVAPIPIGSYKPLTWSLRDSVLIVALIIAAAALRFWHIGHPAEIVFDEVHFVGQARHYLHGESFLDPHPPLAKLIIAVGIALFGDHSASWRLGNAALGTLLVAVTYLLGRRMFRSRLAAALGAGFVACDGLFLVDSRIACIDIVYLTFAAISYLLLFRFIQTNDRFEQHRTLFAIGIALGLCLGSKLYVPAITALLVVGFLVFSMLRPHSGSASCATGTVETDRHRLRRALGGVLMVGSLSTIVYLMAFLPHYFLGWWGGVADLLHYYKDVIWYERSVSTATHPYASPWWSWPLMLRPVAYWQNFPQQGNVATIWGAGNPLTWWGVIPAMMITAIHAMERPNITNTFVVLSFLAYFLIWVPIGRILFLYHYMPSVYIGYLALGAVLAEFWNGEAPFWETCAILVAIFPVFVVGIGHIAIIYKPSFIPSRFYAAAGIPTSLILVLIYALLLRRTRTASRFVVGAFLTISFALFVYYLPVWLGTPITRNGYYARMWLEGPGLRNWI